MIYTFFGKNSSGGVLTGTDKSAIKSEILTNQQLTEKLTKSFIGKLENRKIYLFLKITFAC